MRSRTGIAIMVATGMFATAAVAAPVASTPEQDAQASALANEITVTAARLPAGSSESAYEAQFAALFANSQYSCSVVRTAIAHVTGAPKAAATALRDVNHTLTTCGGGTAAVAGGPLTAASAPGFAVGGSDYTP